MKQTLLMTCIAGSLLFSGVALADSIKPGQRMIYDDRAPKEPSELDKPVFNKPIVAPKQTREQPARDEAPDVQNDEESSTTDDMDESGNVSTEMNDDTPPVYVTPDGESDEGDTDELGLEDRSPQDQRKLRKMTDDIMENMPHKNVKVEDLTNLSPEEQVRMVKELKVYTRKHGKQIQEEVAE